MTHSPGVSSPTLRRCCRFHAAPSMLQCSFPSLSHECPLLVSGLVPPAFQPWVFYQTVGESLAWCCSHQPSTLSFSVSTLPHSFLSRSLLASCGPAKYALQQVHFSWAAFLPLAELQSLPTCRLLQPGVCKLLQTSASQPTTSIFYVLMLTGRLI